MTSRRTWRPTLGTAGLFLLAGGLLHPRADPSHPFFESTALMLADRKWIISHAFLLVSDLMLVAAIVGLLRLLVTSRATRTTLLVVLVGALLSTVEMSFHLAAVVDLDALRTGMPAPIVAAHLAIAVVAYPLLGFSMAVLAIQGGRARQLGSPAISWLAVVGGTASGIAAPIVVLSRDQHYGFLFSGGALMAVWMMLVAVWPVGGAARTTVVRA